MKRLLTLLTIMALVSACGEKAAPAASTTTTTQISTVGMPPALASLYMNSRITPAPSTALTSAEIAESAV